MRRGEGGGFSKGRVVVVRRVGGAMIICSCYFPPSGRVVDHGVEFRRTRDAYLANIVVETNRLVIRLEKVGVSRRWVWSCP